MHPGHLICGGRHASGHGRVARRGALCPVIFLPWLHRHNPPHRAPAGFWNPMGRSAIVGLPRSNLVHHNPLPPNNVVMADAPQPPVVINAPGPQRLESSGSGSSGDSDHYNDTQLDTADMEHGEYSFAPPVQATNGVDEIAPLRESAYGWNAATPPASRPRGPQIMTDVPPANNYCSAEK